MAAAKTKRKRQTIGEDPLASLIPSRETAASSRRRSSKATEPGPEQEKPGRVPKVRATFHIPKALLEEARDAVVALLGPPERLTLATFAETAIRRELGRLKKKHNAGEDFPTRSAELRGGRPIGS